MREKELDEKYLLMVSTTLPIMRAVARLKDNQVAYLLLDAQEALVRAGEYEASSTIAMLATCALEEPEIYRMCVEAIDSIAGVQIPSVDSHLEREKRRAGLADLSHSETMDQVKAKFGLRKLKPKELEEAVFQILRRRKQWSS